MYFALPSTVFAPDRVTVFWNVEFDALSVAFVIFVVPANVAFPALTSVVEPVASVAAPVTDRSPVVTSRDPELASVLPNVAPAPNLVVAPVASDAAPETELAPETFNVPALLVNVPKVWLPAPDRVSVPAPALVKFPLSWSTLTSRTLSAPVSIVPPSVPHANLKSRLVPKFTV